MTLPKPTTLELRLEFPNPESPDKDGALYVIFNRPNRKNAINTQMYNEISDALDHAKKDDRIKLVVT